MSSGEIKPDVFVGDVGTEIVLNCGVDISASTVRKIIVRKPNGQRVEWIADPFGVDAITYTTLVGDISHVGQMTLQAYIEMPGWKGYGDKVKMLVGALT